MMELKCHIKKKCRNYKKKYFSVFGHSCNCSSTLVIAFASLLFMCTDSVKGLSWNQGLYICVSTYAVVCACVHVCVRQSVRLGMEGVSRGRVFLCTDKPLS